MKPKIIVTRDIPDEVELKLKQYFQVSFNRKDKVFSNDILTVSYTHLTLPTNREV